MQEIQKIQSATSISALSEHLRIGYAHSFEANRTEVVAFEKNLRRRKIVESLAILHKTEHLCNTGLSTDISDMWAACLAHVQMTLETE